MVQGFALWYAVSMEIDRWKVNAQVALIFGIILFCPTMLGWSIGQSAGGLWA